MESSFNRRADKLIVDGRYADARALLDAAIHEMPAGWTPKREDDRFLTIAFWDQEEFLAHSHREIEMKRLTKSISWVDGSYSRAWYQLAVVASKEGRFENGLFCIDCGLELEPDHPELWNEKGYLLGRLKRHREAFDCYVRAASVRDWAPPSQIARALRGQGIQLVDLDRLDEAEDALRRSLELEPDSETAHNELGYIEDLRRKRQAEKEEIPWFLHSFVNPPTDPLTIRLLALVEDLPSIPGPKTVGIVVFTSFLGKESGNNRGSARKTPFSTLACPEVLPAGLAGRPGTRLILEKQPAACEKVGVNSDAIGV